MVRSAGLSLAVLTIALIAPFAAGWAQTEPEPCTWENAEPISVYALEHSGAALRDRCVRVFAETDGWALRVWRRRGIAGETTFVGAYFDDETLRSSLAERPRRIEALGVVGHCGDICAGAADDVICMPVGFCHYYHDPYVQIRDIR